MIELLFVPALGVMIVGTALGTLLLISLLFEDCSWGRRVVVVLVALTLYTLASGARLLLISLGANI